MCTAVVEDDEVDLVRLLLEIALDRACVPRQSVGGGKFFQSQPRSRFALLKTTALRGILTFGDPL